MAATILTCKQEKKPPSCFFTWYVCSQGFVSDVPAVIWWTSGPLALVVLHSPELAASQPYVSAVPLEKPFEALQLEVFLG